MPDTITVVANITNESISGAADGSITLNLTGGTSPYAFHWNLGETSQDIQSLTEGQYAVQITDMNACTKTETFVVAAQTYLVEPFNAFSPNGDGVNDTWNIQNIEEYPNCTVKLFNQWGNLVFESTGYSKSWDGTSDGKEVDSAVYYYVIDLKNGKNPISGSITLMR
jgi:gliding motility-associated-like protein